MKTLIYSCLIFLFILLSFNYFVKTNKGIYKSVSGVVTCRGKYYVNGKTTYYLEIDDMHKVKINKEIYESVFVGGKFSHDNVEVMHKQN